jgi:class 3 adenylate cyclase/predicted ATPase
MRFCGQCATALAGTARPPDAERRQLTVVFCDLVDSTALAGRLDPEELRDVVRAYQGACAAAVQRFEGHIAQYLGDGLLVYFGYPRAHEDAAQRAVRAALDVVESVDRLNAKLERDHGLRVAVRVGAHTGLVVVGEMGEGTRTEQLAVGETPNVAARAQALAAPDTIVITAATHQLVHPFFSCEDLGHHAVKGMERPVQVYRVLGESDARTRLDTPAALTPLIGREGELAKLGGWWAEVRAGRGHVVLLRGEAGIGKSRQVRALRDRLAGEAHVRLECRCSPYHTGSAFHPVVELLERMFPASDAVGTARRLGRLERALAEAGLPAREALPIFAALLGIAPGDAVPPLDLTPQRLRQKTLELLLVWLRATAREQPVLLVVEDLHWADPSTLELLDLLVPAAAATPILALLTARLEFPPRWTDLAHVNELAMTRLAQDETARMVAAVAGEKALPAALVGQIAGRTDGVPLFVEELTRTVLESGQLRELDDRYELTGPLRSLAIPATVQDSLMARLDRLGEAKGVAQLGATIGREFDHALLESVATLPGPALARDLDRLVDSGLVIRRGTPPHATYAFKHALVQDTAYQSLLRATRQQYHQRIATTLVERFPGTAQAQPEVLAHHFTAAGLVQEAISYWHRAGQRAMERSANLEAASHFTQGLELARGIADPAARRPLEVMLQAPLGFSLVLTRGYSAPEVEHAFARVRELCVELGSPPQLYPALYGSWAFYLVRGRYDESHRLGALLLSLGESTGDRGHLLEAHAAQGHNHLWGGCELARSRAHFEQAIALYDPGAHAEHALAYGQDPAVISLSYLSWVLWLGGHPDQALVRHREALELARRRDHAHSLAYALAVGASFRQLRREVDVALELAEAAIALATEQGFPTWIMAAGYTRGWALNQLGRPAEALAQLEAAIGGWQVIGAQVTRPHQLGLLAGVRLALGQVEPGLEAIAVALADVARTGEVYYEPELLRLRGELHLRAGRPEEADASLRESLERARAIGTRAWELRSALSLARFVAGRGDRAEAGRLVDRILGGFTEGFDTPDLRDARALLDATA